MPQPARVRSSATWLLRVLNGTPAVVRVQRSRIQDTSPVSLSRGCTGLAYASSCNTGGKWEQGSSYIMLNRSPCRPFVMIRVLRPRPNKPAMPSCLMTSAAESFIESLSGCVCLTVCTRHKRQSRHWLSDLAQHCCFVDASSIRAVKELAYSNMRPYCPLTQSGEGRDQYPNTTKRYPKMKDRPQLGRPKVQRNKCTP
jgi:hypothetical protein